MTKAGLPMQPLYFFLVSRPGHEGKLLPAVENIIELDVRWTELFDKADIMMLKAPIDLHGDMAFMMILEMEIVENQLTVHIHRSNAPLHTKFGSPPPLYI